jgi:hypothetical protein
MSRATPFDIGFSSAEIIMRRMPLIWWHFWKPTASSRAEMVQMVVEKQMAFAESCFAMQVEGLKMMIDPLKTVTPEVHQQRIEAMTEAALAPVSRRLKANARRLRR